MPLVEPADRYRDPPQFAFLPEAVRAHWTERDKDGFPRWVNTPMHEVDAAVLAEIFRRLDHIQASIDEIAQKCR